MDPDPSLAEFAAAVGRPDGEIRLARAALLIAAAEQPGLDVDRYLARLDDLADTALAARRAADALSRLHRLREFLFEELGFAGDRSDYFDPRNSHLNEVLDRRLGIPITLSLVFIEVGQRLGLQMEGIGLPGHFITGARIAGEHVLLDPFNRGAVLTVEACGQVVRQALGRPVQLRPEHFAPVDNRRGGLGALSDRVPRRGRPRAGARPAPPRPPEARPAQLTMPATYGNRARRRGPGPQGVVGGSLTTMRFPSAARFGVPNPGGRRPWFARRERVTRPTHHPLRAWPPAVTLATR